MVNFGLVVLLGFADLLGFSCPSGVGSFGSWFVLMIFWVYFALRAFMLMGFTLNFVLWCCNAEFLMFLMSFYFWVVARLGCFRISSVLDSSDWFLCLMRLGFPGFPGFAGFSASGSGLLYWV